MAETRALRALGLIVLVALLALPAVAHFAKDPAWISLVTRMLIYAIAAVSLDLILGYGGLACFGHAAFYGLGGYTVAILFHHARSSEVLWGLIPGSTQFLVTVPAAMLVGGVVAAAIGALSLRTAGVQFLMITLAFAQMLFFLFSSIATYGGNDGMTVRRRNEMPGLDLRDDTVFYYLVLALLLLALWAGRRLVRSRFGMVIGGIRQNERRMAAIGIDTYRYKLAAFVIAGMGGALAGALMVNHARFVSPDMMHWTKSGEFMVMVILGGAASLIGPVLGAVTLVGLEDLLGQIPKWGEHRMFAIGAILVLVVLFGKGGLWGWIARRLSRGGDG
ncbi:MAG: branched-chain amino acid ABC transporter permease [Gammaproteobacteria bacterium]|nr:branched-chain amino acid ABC transporter permease [Gammaproteobacteria bacterium]